SRRRPSAAAALTLSALFVLARRFIPCPSESASRKAPDSGSLTARPTEPYFNWHMREPVKPCSVMDYLNEILAATGSQGVNIILEMFANVNLGNDLKLLAPRGRIIVIGSRAGMNGMISGAAVPEDNAQDERAHFLLRLWDACLFQAGHICCRP